MADNKRLLRTLSRDEDLRYAVVQVYLFDETVNRDAVRAFEKVFQVKLPKKGEIRRTVSECVNRVLGSFRRRKLIYTRLMRGKDDYPVLEPALGDELRRKFRLRDVWVVNTKFVRAMGVTDDAEDDQIHRYLANWASRMLSTLIRPGDVVGVGSGRALLEIGKALTSLPGFQGCRAVCALTGRMRVSGAWSAQGQSTTVDADDNADRLCSSLHASDPLVLLQQLKAAITSRKKLDKDTLGKYQQNTTIAVIGIGAIGGRHQLLKVVLEDSFPLELLPLADELKKLARIVRHHDPEPSANDEREAFNNHLVGDVCNWLIVNERLANTMKKNIAVVPKLRSIVDKINDGFLNTSPRELAGICRKGAVVAVSGGRHKAAAITEVLLQSHSGIPWGGPFISHLVVDDLVAYELKKFPDATQGGVQGGLGEADYSI